MLSPKTWQLKDYHVFAVHKSMVDKKAYVYDFDTLMRFPEPFESYFSKSFNTTRKLSEKYVR